MKLDKKIKDLLALVAMIVVSIIASSFLISVPFMQGLELSLITERFKEKNYLSPDIHRKDYVVQGEKVNSDIMIMAIDELSLSEDFLGPFPWERTVYAEFLKYFSYENRKNAPHYVFFDIFFDQYRMPQANDALIKDLSTEIFESRIWNKSRTVEDFNNSTLNLYKGIPTSDMIFYKELEKHNNVFVDYLIQFRKDERWDVKELQKRIQYVLKSALVPKNPEVYAKARLNNNAALIVPDIKPPVEEVGKSVLGIGSAHVESDADGVVRKMPLLFLYQDERFMKDGAVFLPTVDLSIIMNYYEAEPKDLEIEFGKNITIRNAKIPLKKCETGKGCDILGFKTEDVVIPIDAEGKMYINYQGSSHSFENLSFAYVNLDQAHDNASYYKDRMLLVGFYSVAGLGDTKDYHVTTYGNMYGIEIHANALYTITNSNYVREIPSWLNWLLAILIILAVGMVLFKLNIIKGLIYGVFALILVYSGGIALFSGKIAAPALIIAGLGLVIVFSKVQTSRTRVLWLGVILFFGLTQFLASQFYFLSFMEVPAIEFITPPLYLMNMTLPLAAIVVALILNISYKVLTEEKEKKWIKGIFGSYVNPEVVNELIMDPTKLGLGGETRELTVLFSDIRGFTTLSENFAPEDLVIFLNKYLSSMTDILMRNKGTLDKYIGDAVMCFWGAPIYTEKHAFLACKTALEMMVGLHEYNAQMPENQQIDIGIGINTGGMTVGNMGSELRKNYTIMGDNVNLGSRLEGATKMYKSHIIISESTYEHIKEEFIVRPLDLIRVKGKKKPVKIYELLGFREELDKFGENFESFRIGS